MILTPAELETLTALRQRAAQHSSERMTEKYLRDRDVRVVRGPTRGAK